MSSAPNDLKVRARDALRSLRELVEIAVVIVMTWFALGRVLVDDSVGQHDENFLVLPLLRSALEAGTDWSDHLYRVGVLGGSKMHEFAGTTPVTQLAAALGVSPTWAANANLLFLQFAIAFLSLSIVRALRGGRAEPPFLVRVAVIGACAFAPVLGWRFAFGHENLVLGLTPYLAALALVLAARERSVRPTLILIAAITVWNGLSGLGSQTVIYGAVFGAPLVAGALLDSPRGARWTRDHWIAVATLVAGVLLALPRLLPMLMHAAGPDASRSLSESVVYSYGDAQLRDWLESVPWMQDAAASHGEAGLLHERNYPLGPWLCCLPLLWRYRQRWLVVGFGVSAVLALGLALDLPLISGGLRAVIPPLEAFRVPARAMLPLAVALPAVGIGMLLRHMPSVEDEARKLRTADVVALAGGLVLLVARDWVPSIAWELAGWALCITLLVAPHIFVARTPTHARAALLALSVIGIVAFDARFARTLPRDPIERGPTELRAAALAAAPELADPLHRIKVSHPPGPYRMSLAFAAGLGSVDGVWYPPRRFIALVSSLFQQELPATAAVFALSSSPAFPVLQQLYNVRYEIDVRKGAIASLPATPGGAWFPRRVELLDEPAAFARTVADASRAGGLASALRNVAWVLKSDLGVPLPPLRCSDATVEHVASQGHGQAVDVRVRASSTCLLVLSMNYTSTLVATGELDGRPLELRMLPIDVALAGVIVPAGVTSIRVAPRISVPAWARFELGLAALVLVLIAGRRRRPA